MFELGAGSLGATLAAYTYVLGGTYLVTNYLPVPGQFRMMQVPVYGPLNFPFIQFNQITRGLRFPYGFLVEPDSPV